jgi:hypothetical protein
MNPRQMRGDELQDGFGPVRAAAVCRAPVAGIVSSMVTMISGSSSPATRARRRLWLSSLAA